ncbi:MAG: hypothetical protein D6706_06630 [Chloroflexi bacterium]|nr:MAG: hypothetical protein D6706_06630 [Chloroflexota bacterium]
MRRFRRRFSRLFLVVITWLAVLGTPLSVYVCGCVLSVLPGVPHDAHHHAHAHTDQGYSHDGHEAGIGLVAGGNESPSETAVSGIFAFLEYPLWHTRIILLVGVMALIFPLWLAWYQARLVYLLPPTPPPL